MKGIKSLKCHPTGCWTPNDLPQCIREDLEGNSSWADSDSGSLPLVISLVTVSTGLAVIALFTTSCLVVLCRRKGGPVPHPSGPAHWSTTVTVTPDCRTRSGELFAIPRNKYILAEVRGGMLHISKGRPGGFACT